MEALAAHAPAAATPSSPRLVAEEGALDALVREQAARGPIRRTPPLENAALCIELEQERLAALRDYMTGPDAELARRGIRAWLLAPDIPMYEALMRGESVPLAKLNADAVRRYGLR